MLSYAKVIHEDPVRRGMLYLGTENAIYVSFDAGDTWQPLQNDLPHAPVSGIVVQEHFNDLVISTYGRGFWILDDITPLRAMTPEVLGADAHLFPPRAAYRFRGITAPSTPYDDPTVGENPQYGASINYYLKQARAGRRHGHDHQRRRTRSCARCTVPGGAGLNRVHWDLRCAPTQAAAVPHQPDVRPRAAARRGRHAAAGRRRPADGGAGAARDLHGEARPSAAATTRSRSRCARTRTPAAPRPTSQRRRRC